ncbi:DNA primase [Aeromicrobium wangtongii]|uniref:DNA primase n=1 Tax=Aeromicrobium wangtongii TaxID=2969247 RepID=A0ABY5MAP5_9ACTN|nr:DNA primase [Aeromicrobium wangtongii]MCD9197393.1 DNA primase [Aeromicrobium wangtongii]UUP14887.1 DNA primase [Aeromicrobium wangtongii]
MAGRIKDEDIQLVRERTRIDEVVEQYVTLKNAGGGSRKGLCPFHDEKSPSFNVRPSVGSYHCFGCGAGGDVFKFVMEIEGLSFVETVERLAAKSGITLRYEDGGTPGPRRDPNQRPRLLAAHREAGEFYAATLQSSPDAQAGRQFVKDRGFDQAAAEKFGMGFAPRGGEQLVAHLKSKGFTDDELVVGGLASRGNRGLYDRFRGRLLWPIREMTGEVIGFGARRMFDDDRVEAKYLNTSETPIYKKSQVLYGLDLARRSISSSGQAVIVEGYTDVMACHEAGVTTAVATCGTAFGEDHARVMRRLMLDDQAFHGEVIFTFDGDEAGQRAAIKTFNGDQQFVAQTYVAVEPRGMDPCDLRLADGDAAVRELVASRIPLYRFVLENMLSKYDLDRGDQRVDAVREAVTLASAIRDRSKVDELLREIAGRVGTDVDQVRSEHRRRMAIAAKATPGQQPVRPGQAEAPAPPPPSPAVNFGLPQFADEREALKAIVQHPHLAAKYADDLDDNDFTHPISKVLWKHIEAMPWPTGPDSNWLPQLADSVHDEDAKRILSIAAVEPLHARGNTAAVVMSDIIRLQILTLGRRVAEVKSKLQRTNPIDEAETYNRMFGELIALEQQLRDLRDRSLAGDVPS